MEQSNIKWVYTVLLLIGLLFSTQTFGQEEIQLRWDPSTDNVGVAGYNLWLNGQYYGTTADTTFVLTLENGMHALAVSAFDAAGNESEKSEVLMVEIGDGTPPTVPDNLIIVYPNPTFGDFRVEITRPLLPNSDLRIITPNGQIIFQRPITDYDQAHIENFNLGTILTEGLYIIDVIENGQRAGYAHLMVSGRPKLILTMM